MSKFSLTAIAIVSFASGAWPALATDIPAAGYSGSISAYAVGVVCDAHGSCVETPQNNFSDTITGPTSLSNVVSAPGSSLSYAVSVTNLPSPGISMTMSATAATGPADMNGNRPAAGADIAAELKYYIEFVGPTDTLVPVHVTMAGSASQDSVAGSSAVDENHASATITWTTISTACAPGCGDSSSFEYDGEYDDAFLSNTVYAIDLSVTVTGWSAGRWDGGTETLSAWADPVFALVGPDADEYSILLSPGIGNSLTAPVPEPSTWAMLLLGFSGISLFGYRKSRRLVPA